MSSAHKAPRFLVFLYVLLTLALAWWLARALVVGAIAERNQALLSKAYQQQPWFSWSLQHPQEIVGPYAVHWQTANNGLVNTIDKPVISLPMGGSTLDFQVFPRLSLHYSATRPWQMRIHVRPNDNAPEYYSSEILLPGGNKQTIGVTLSTLNWHVIPPPLANQPDSKKTPEKNHRNTPPKQTRSLLLYFHPAKGSQAISKAQRPQITVHSISFPWPKEVPRHAAPEQTTHNQQPSDKSTPLHIRKQPLECHLSPFPATNGMAQPENAVPELVVHQLSKPCALPESILWLEKQIRTQAGHLLIPHTAILPPWPFGHFLALMLFAGVVMAMIWFCRSAQKVTGPIAHSSQILWLGLVFLLLAGTYVLTGAFDRLGSLPRATGLAASAIIGLSLFVWALFNDFKQLISAPTKAGAAAVLILLGSGLIGFLLLSSHHQTIRATAFVAYFSWAIFQQIVIGPVLAQRLHQRCRLSVIESAALAGLVFALLHFPNPMLMLATIIAGSIWAWLWLKYRLLLPLAISHAVLALALFTFSGQWWLASGRVGAAFLNL